MSQGLFVGVLTAELALRRLHDCRAAQRASAVSAPLAAGQCAHVRAALGSFPPAHQALVAAAASRPGYAGASSRGHP